jgi:DNA repair photolyase
MRWDGLRLDEVTAAPGARIGGAPGHSDYRRPGADARGMGNTAVHGPQAALFGPDAVARTFDTPGFRGMTFYEVYAKSIINKVPPASRMPFQFTINPYRGCGHACVYCFARNTHTYLDLDAGLDFNSKIIVKVNAAELTRKELGRPRWAGEHIAMGTNVDCYQRAEGRYRLMPGIIAALRDARNPFSILTKGTLVLRDLDLIKEAAEVTPVALNMSVGFADADLSAQVEPGTPSPQRRLDACSAITSRGLRCGILMGPVLPYLSDSPGQLAETVRQIAAAGAASVTPIVLHLRPGAREWFLAWLAERHPDLVPRYRRLYGSGAYASKDYQRRISACVAELAARYRVGSAAPAAARRLGHMPPTARAALGDDSLARKHGVQLSLL